MPAHLRFQFLELITRILLLSENLVMLQMQLVLTMLQQSNYQVQISMAILLWLFQFQKAALVLRLSMATQKKILLLRILKIGAQNSMK